jgi:hypothetical protein
MPAGQQQPATASVAGGAASLLREERWQAHSPEQRRGLPPLCAIALAPALGGQRFGAHLIQRFRRENSKKLKKASEYCQQKRRSWWWNMPEIGEEHQHCYQDAFLMAVPMFR